MFLRNLGEGSCNGSNNILSVVKPLFCEYITFQIQRDIYGPTLLTNMVGGDVKPVVHCHMHRLVLHANEGLDTVKYSYRHYWNAP